MEVTSACRRIASTSSPSRLTTGHGVIDQYLSTHRVSTGETRRDSHSSQMKEGEAFQMTTRGIILRDKRKRRVEFRRPREGWPFHVASTISITFLRRSGVNYVETSEPPLHWPQLRTMQACVDDNRPTTNYSSHIRQMRRQRWTGIQPHTRVLNFAG